jgi:hypothetical protein
MHGYSTLDPKKPGDATVLVGGVQKMAAFLRSKNPVVDLHLMATWSRADQTYQADGAWFGKPIDAMARDVRAGYDLAAAATPAIKGVVPVGEAWARAMQSGVASANPYADAAAGKLNLWAYDNYHASSYGYYLEALVLFGSLTGRDPRSLGGNECSGFELGFSPEQVGALQQVAFDQLAVNGPLRAAPLQTTRSMEPMPCTRTR